MWEVQQEIPLPKMDTYIYTHNANYKLAKVSNGYILRWKGKESCVS